MQNDARNRYPKTPKPIGVPIVPIPPSIPSSTPVNPVKYPRQSRQVPPSIPSSLQTPSTPWPAGQPKNRQRGAKHAPTDTLPIPVRYPRQADPARPPFPPQFEFLERFGDLAPQPPKSRKTNRGSHLSFWNASGIWHPNRRKAAKPIGVPI